MKILSQFAEYEEFRTRTKQRKGQPPPGALKNGAVDREDLSPREAIEDVMDSAHSAVAADLLARVLKQSPAFLEQLVLRLLVKMGYGGLETPTEHLGAPGDAGLDGLIRLDPPDPFRSVHDLGRVPGRCSWPSGIPIGRSPRWLPAGLPVAEDLADWFGCCGPSVFQAGHIPSWRGSCERYALSPVAAACRWLLLLLSPLLSAVVRARRL